MNLTYSHAEKHYYIFGDSYTEEEVKQRYDYDRAYHYISNFDTYGEEKYIYHCFRNHKVVWYKYKGNVFNGECEQCKDGRRMNRRMNRYNEKAKRRRMRIRETKLLEINMKQ